jgi:ubiquinone/menaquinone biosynthesis C-methylase UbiE
MLKTIIVTTDIEEVEQDIYSCIKPEDRNSEYDNKVKAYDYIVGNAYYNKLIWGNWPANYSHFCTQALLNSKGGLYLDAGCGSLVFTAKEYANADNELIVLLDRSLGMLRKGRERIIKLCGKVPDNIIFLQGDILNLPFLNSAFNTVASFGVLHMFEKKLTVLAELERVRKISGGIYFSCLAGNNLVGKKYLEILKDAGEVASCVTSESLRQQLALWSNDYVLSSIGNMAYGRSLNIYR